jgi:diguanylate cyclase (GGDEF)-like protein
MPSFGPLLIDRLFWPLLLLTLLGIALFEYGPERELNVLTRDRLVISALDDGIHKGSSRARLLPGEQPGIDCDLRDSYRHPFCEIIFTLSEPEQGLDLSGFSRMTLAISVDGPTPQEWRIYLRNYDPSYSRPDDPVSHKVNEVLFRNHKPELHLEIPLKVFSPATWWIQDYRIPLLQQGPDLSRIFAVELASGAEMPMGEYRLRVEKLSFYGPWLAAGLFYRGLLAFWLGYGLLVFLMQHLLLRDKLRRARAAWLQAEQRNQTLSEQSRRSEMEARYDPLTGALNRLGGQTLLSELGDMPLSVIYLDLDHFKRVNDNHGHAIGDEVLKHLVSEVLVCCDSLCRLIRWGGEEFILICLHYEEARARTLAERIRLALAAYDNWPASLSITASFGVAERRGDPLEQALVRADDALYRAKERGRNRVEVG